MSTRWRLVCLSVTVPTFLTAWRSIDVVGDASEKEQEEEKARREQEEQARREEELQALRVSRRRLSSYMEWPWD